MSGPRIRTFILVLALLTVVWASLAPYHPFWTTVAQPPVEGDWYVNNTTVVQDRNITLDGDLMIGHQGFLTLDNVTLIMKSGQGGSTSIKVGDSGKLTMKGSTVMPETTGKGYNFLVEGGNVVIEDSVIEGLWGGSGISGPQGLAVLEEGGLTMRRSSIMAARGTGAHIGTSGVLIEDSDVSGNGGNGIYIGNRSSPRIVRTTVTGNAGHGVLMEEESSPELLDCTISDNSRNGVEVKGAAPTISGNRITDNSGHGLSAADSSGISLHEGKIYGNSGWGVLSIRGPVDIDGVVWEKDGKENTIGRLSQSWKMVVEVKGMDDEPREGVEVTVQGNSTINGPISTDAMGKAIFNNLKEFQMDNDGDTVFESPYNVTVALRSGVSDPISKTVSVDLSSNIIVPVKFDLPNLVVSNLHVSKDDFTKGEVVEVSVVVTNIGGTDPGRSSVTFYDGSKVIKEKDIEGLDTGASEEVSVKWKTDGVASGRHRIRAVVDPGNDVAEIDETDNEISTKVDVGESMFLTYAIPILLVIGIVGLAGFKIYNWVLLKRLENEQKRKGTKKGRRKKGEVEFREIREEEE